ncbi:Fic family protein [Fictibacillus terranigra]
MRTIEFYPTLEEKAAVYHCFLAIGHCFFDGNKRTSYAKAFAF